MQTSPPSANRWPASRVWKTTTRCYPRCRRLHPTTPRRNLYATAVYVVGLQAGEIKEEDRLQTEGGEK
ncbi:hypothetical protein GQ55_5G360400 [Panicum hallii var. hallii]|uniref:Uncharacterized protein n=1 Tax=Panicum hallii var. hallii TaxID=1504633 RepID=A0A2T7DMH3_9POAL|nr:hypothetical protein GQ55_5G360400 [Panicum hallii var. hallii]